METIFWNATPNRASFFGWAQVVWNSIFNKKVDFSSAKNLVTFTTLSLQHQRLF